MPQLCRVAIVDPDFSRAKILILHLNQLDVRQIEYFSDRDRCFQALSDSTQANHTNIVFLTTDKEHNSKNIEFVSKIMSNRDLSHIQIYAVTDSQGEQYLINLLRNGAIGHLTFPISSQQVSGVLLKASKLIYKIS